MTQAAELGLIALLSYLIGAVPFGYLVARWRGVDIFQQGSGNIGATNVGRVLGRKFGILVFVLDFLKGALPALAAKQFAQHNLPDEAGVAAGLAAFLGHLFPIYLRFRGGKGVATGAGVVTVLVPMPTLAALFAWFVVVSASRIVSLASLVAAVVLCLLRLVLTPAPFATNNLILTLFCLATSGIVFARHHANIRRLLSGTENRLKDSPAMFTLAKTLHVLAVGLWFGMGVFFTFVVAFSLFGSFEREALKKDEYIPLHEDPTSRRPSWFPISPYYRETIEGARLPDPLLKEQGTRAAGFAIAPLFDWYFRLQLGCGLVALVTALAWWKAGAKVHRIRAVVLGLALLGVAGGWWLEVKSSELNLIRNETTDELLVISKPTEDDREQTAQARAEFGKWHGISMAVNLATVLLASFAMVLAAQLPPANPRSEPAVR